MPLAVIKRLSRPSGMNPIQYNQPAVDAIGGQQNGAFEKVERRFATAVHLGPDVLVPSFGVDVVHNPTHKRGNYPSYCPLLTLRV
ncbi:MAG TPA: hypothetical protein DDZ51_18385, partial [Planctomycetaceae bacterium]|nr:hypothetical protein [Planctomycetaceae bacterium]